MWFFLISLVGGIIGVVVGMFAFNHKTNELPGQDSCGDDLGAADRHLPASAIGIWT